MPTKQQELFFSVHNFFSFCSSYCCPPLRLEREKKERRVDAAITEVVTATTTEVATAMATMEAATVTATAMATTEAATTEAATMEAVTAITEVASTEAATAITEVATTEVTADMDVGSLAKQNLFICFNATV